MLGVSEFVDLSLGGREIFDENKPRRLQLNSDAVEKHIDGDIGNSNTKCTQQNKATCISSYRWGLAVISSRDCSHTTSLQCDDI